MSQARDEGRLAFSALPAAPVRPVTARYAGQKGEASAPGVPDLRPSALPGAADPYTRRLPPPPHRVQEHS